ncbi:putative F-box protein At5g62660 [Capsella rubella]|uniref:putative F-box protein At5g62660 n=1 Tax=Capsella rubella TaxID=81985 RepID=UPI000CD52AAD|nr:putative F-box protein At5g62660 [Capsella rubella]
MGSSFRLAVMQRGSKKKRRRRRQPEIPMDVVMAEILTRLPANLLMRLKCVSKLWSSLISSRYMRNRFLTVPSPPRLYMSLRDLTEYRNCMLLTLSPDTAAPSTFVVDHNRNISRMESHVLQNLGGFMCYCFSGKPRLFNPVTRQLVTLPSIEKYIFKLPPEEGSSSCYSYCFFGLDPSNNRYKVLCSFGVYLEDSKEYSSEHRVFVLKPGGTRRRGSWKKVAPTPPDFLRHISIPRGLSINGFIYYLAWTDVLKSTVVSFDTRSEKFMAMLQLPCKNVYQLPEVVAENLTLIEYGGKATIFDKTNLRDKGLVDLWVVEDAANKKWSRKTLVLQPSQLHLVNNIILNVRGTTQNGKVLLVPHELISPFHVLCYDLQSNDMRKIEIKSIPDHWFSKDKASVDIDLMFMDHSESILYLET